MRSRRKPVRRWTAIRAVGLGIVLAAAPWVLFAQSDTTATRTAELTPAGRPFRSHYHRAARYLSKPLPKPPFKVAIIDCEDMVTEAFYEPMKRRIDEALDAGCTMLIFQITTPGGLKDVSDEIMHMLLDVGERVHTVAYVPREASSAGAFIALSCQDIVMGPTATMGSAAVVVLQGELDPVMRKKIEAKMVSQLEILAETNGYPEALCKAFSIPDLDVFSIRNRQDGETYYFTRPELPEDTTQWSLTSRRPVTPKPEKKILNMPGKEAVQLGFVSAVVESMDDLLALYEIEGEPMVLKLTWSESMFAFLAHPILRGLLMTGMLIGIFIELRTPGVGIPGLAALICFVLLFGSSLFLGLSQWWAPAALLIGVVLLFIEVFVTPGFGVLGISGALLMLLGLFGLFVPPSGEGWEPNFVPATAFGWRVFQQGVIVLPISFAVSLAAMLLLGRFLGKVPLFGKIVLATADAETKRVTAAGVSAKTDDSKDGAKKQPQVGQRGLVRSVLRPAGTAEFDGRLLEVVCDGDFIEPGAQVQIVAIEGNRIHVEKTGK